MAVRGVMMAEVGEHSGVSFPGGEAGAGIGSLELPEIAQAAVGLILFGLEIEFFFLDEKEVVFFLLD